MPVVMFIRLEVIIYRGVMVILVLVISDGALLVMVALVCASVCRARDHLHVHFMV